MSPTKATGPADGSAVRTDAAGLRVSRVGRRTIAMLTGLALAGLAPWLLGCGGNSVGSVGGPSDGEGLKVVATTSVLADIAQRVAGDRFRVEALIPPGTDPHVFEPTPSDLKRIVGADLVIVNGAGLEGDLEDYLDDVDENSIVVASEGLTSRTPAPGEPGHAADGEEHAEEAEEHADEQAHEGEADPHFWLDPVLVQTYVQNIAAAFEMADPDHAAEYAAGAEAFDQELIELDAWTSEQVAALPAERRKLVMNHASHGYWADRYGFDVVGAVIPSVSTGSAPTAKDLAELLETIEREGVPAIFVQTGENPRLASQIAADTGIVVVDDLFTGSLSETDGVAPSYLEMMRYNTGRIVEALKP